MLNHCYLKLVPQWSSHCFIARNKKGKERNKRPHGDDNEESESEDTMRHGLLKCFTLLSMTLVLSNSFVPAKHEFVCSYNSHTTGRVLLLCDDLCFTRTVIQHTIIYTTGVA